MGVLAIVPHSYRSTSGRGMLSQIEPSLSSRVVFREECHSSSWMKTTELREGQGESQPTDPHPRIRAPEGFGAAIERRAAFSVATVRWSHPFSG